MHYYIDVLSSQLQHFAVGVKGNAIREIVPNRQNLSAFSVRCGGIGFRDSVFVCYKRLKRWSARGTGLRRTGLLDIIRKPDVDARKKVKNRDQQRMCNHARSNGDHEFVERQPSYICRTSWHDMWRSHVLSSLMCPFVPREGSHKTMEE